MDCPNESVEDISKNERKRKKNSDKEIVGKESSMMETGTSTTRIKIIAVCNIFVGGTVAVRSLRSVRAHKLKRKPDDSS